MLCPNPLVCRKLRHWSIYSCLASGQMCMARHPAGTDIKKDS